MFVPFPTLPSFISVMWIECFLKTSPIYLFRIISHSSICWVIFTSKWCLLYLYRFSCTSLRVVVPFNLVPTTFTRFHNFFLCVWLYGDVWVYYRLYSSDCFGSRLFLYLVDRQCMTVVLMFDHVDETFSPSRKDTLFTCDWWTGVVSMNINRRFSSLSWSSVFTLRMCLQVSSHYVSSGLTCDRSVSRHPLT